jgi:hypothetical protein
MQNRFFRKKFKKVCILQRKACTQIRNFKRNFLENYNDSEHVVKQKMLFHELSEYQHKWQLFPT